MRGDDAGPTPDAAGDAVDDAADAETSAETGTETDTDTDGARDSDGAETGRDAARDGGDLDDTLDDTRPGDALDAEETDGVTDGADAGPDADGRGEIDGVGDVGSGPGEHGFMLRRIEVEALLDQFGGGHPGVGAAGDYDGDGKTDLFIGRGGTFDLTPGPACIFFNRSTRGGEIRFEKIEEICFDQSTTGAAGMDVDGDGKDELAVFQPGATNGRVALYRVDIEAPALEQIGRTLVVPGDYCPAMVPWDIEYDGDADLLIGCATVSKVAVWNGEELSLLRLAFPPLERSGFTYGIAGIDVNHDGLIDLARYNDTFSTPSSRNTALNPGGIHRRCVPGSSCWFHPERWEYGFGDMKYGGFMGIAAFHVPAIGELIYLTDAGNNRALEYGPDGLVEDHGEALDVDHTAVVSGRWVFSWSALTHDFDGDGLDDLYVVNGGRRDEAELNPDEHAFEDHWDIVLLQRDDGFVTLSEEVGILPNEELDSTPRQPYGPHGAVKEDFNGDGHIEIVEFAANGRPRMYTVDTGPRRGCKLIPRERYVYTRGYGYAVARDDSPDVWRHWDIQGHYFASTADAVYTSRTEGTIRFPSGWTTRFSCGPESGYTSVIEEPAWLEVSRTGEMTVSLRVERDIDELEVRGRNEMLRVSTLDVTRAEDGAFSVSLADPTTREIFLRVGDKWVGRWFPLPAAPDGAP